MRTVVLSANLGNFDTPVDSVKQDWEVDFHRFTDDNFPPITGLTPRLQYRIPKMFGWQMYPGYDIYIWLDASMSLPISISVQWFLDQLGNGDIALFNHPWRKTIAEEADHVEEYLNKGDRYLTPRYKNGLHKEQYVDIMGTGYIDDRLYASTAFIYRDSERMRDALRMWWLHSSRYFTVDQIALPYAVKDLDVRILEGNPFKHDKIAVTSPHK